MDFKINHVADISFDYDDFSQANKNSLEEISGRLLEDLHSNSVIGIEKRKNGNTIEVARYYPQHSKSIIDEIDKLLAQHYGFTDEELDFIINYDIKYRMGREAEEG